MQVRVRCHVRVRDKVIRLLLGFEVGVGVRAWVRVRAGVGARV